MPRRFAACLLVCLFAGLGAAPALAQLIYAPPRMPAADTGDYSRIHRIAILSAIGGRIPVWNRGSGKDQALDSSGWQIDGTGDGASTLAARSAGSA